MEARSMTRLPSSVGRAAHRDEASSRSAIDSPASSRTITIAGAERSSDHSARSWQSTIYSVAALHRFKRPSRIDKQLRTYDSPVSGTSLHKVWW